MAVVTPDQVRAVVDTDLAEPDLADVIAREEAALARKIGPLAGERTEIFRPIYRPNTTMSGLMLKRPTDALAELWDNAADRLDVAYLSTGGWVIERSDYLPWSGPTVMATYTPNDLLEVERVVIELCRLGLASSPFTSETIGSYSYARAAGGPQGDRRRLLNSLGPPRWAWTMKTLGSIETTWKIGPYPWGPPA